MKEERRKFIKETTRKAVKNAIMELSTRVQARAVHWIRPPYAVDEMEFLMICTRCSACIDACEHDVIFSLPARVGMLAAATPALDLVNKGCHLCSNWACVVACKPGALKLPQADGQGHRPLPRLANVWLDTGACLPYRGPECSACAGVCPIEDVLTWKMGKPSIDSDNCVGCALCREACIVEPKAIHIKSLAA